MAVYLIGTLDTKGRELAHVRDVLRECGVDARLIDAGCQGEPVVPADIAREEVFAAAGADVALIKARGDRGEAIAAAARGVAALIAQLHAGGNVDGVLAIGGSAGTTIGTAAMRALPIGIPKVMVSTMASGQTRHYVQDKDICLINSVTDIAGLNRISRTILGSAARALAGMVKFRDLGASEDADRPLIAATMFGVTTPCVERARKVLEAAGYEVLVFHATGAGGQAMESLIRDGLIAGVLDITTTEIADELVGGVLSAGPTRLTAAGEAGISQVISVGAVDMVNFGGVESHGLPQGASEAFRGRLFYRHNPSVTLMRTTAEENARIGADIARKAAAARGPCAILLPAQGVSAIDRAGQPFDDPAARQALFDAIRRDHATVPLVERDLHINDPEFAELAANTLLAMLSSVASAPRRGIHPRAENT